jgi:iron complex outermembrane recepter protein
LNNELTTGGCYDINYAGGSIFPGVVTGAPVHGPAGSGKILCGPTWTRAASA